MPDTASGECAEPGPPPAAFGAVLPRSFFDRPSLEVAPDLLGRVLVRRDGGADAAIRLTEVEAYAGPHDPASHAYRGRTTRNATMFGPPGGVYVYFTYGMHYCVNLVCGPVGEPLAVLLRAGEVVYGIEHARARRPSARNDRELARGPARLTQALAIDLGLDGADVCSADGPLVLLTGDPVPETARRRGPRTGVAAAADLPWRFWIGGDPSVSPYRRQRDRAGRADSTVRP